MTNVTTLAHPTEGRCSFDHATQGHEYMRALGFRADNRHGWHKPGYLGCITFHQGRFHAAWWQSTCAPKAYGPTAR